MNRETGSDFCQVRVCGCGLYYLTIGTVTLKLTPEMFQNLAATVGGATTDGVYVELSNCGAVN